MLMVNSRGQGEGEDQKGMVSYDNKLLNSLVENQKGGLRHMKIC